MKFWPVLTGVAVALTLVLASRPLRRKAYSPSPDLMPAAILANGMKSRGWKTALNAAWSRLPRPMASAATGQSAC